MFTLLPQFIAATLEKLLLKYIRLDPEALQKLQRLQGKQLAFTLRELNITLVLTATRDTILVGKNAEAADCRISADLASLSKLRDPAQLTRLIRADALDIAGDIQIAQQFSHFLQQLNPDWEQALSRYFGDALAHKLVRTAWQLHQYLTQKSALLSQMTTELMQDELTVTPTRTETEWFGDQVSFLSAKVAHLDQQLRLLQE